MPSFLLTRLSGINNASALSGGGSQFTRTKYDLCLDRRYFLAKYQVARATIGLRKGFQVVAEAKLPKTIVFAAKKRPMIKKTKAPAKSG